MLSIVMPAATTQLAALADVKAALDLTGTDNDALLTAMIGRASDTAASYCNRTFARQDYSETLNVECPTDALLLSRTPLVSVASVTLNGDALDSDKFVVDLSLGAVAAVWPSWLSAGQYVVQYTAGFALPDDADPTLPQDIQAAAIALVRGQWFAVGRDTSLRSDSVEGIGATSWQSSATGLPVEACTLLDRWRVPSVA